MDLSNNNFFMSENAKFMQYFSDSYVQTFDDTGQGRPELVRIFPMSEITKNVTLLEDINGSGAGIFFTPNPCKGGRKEENVQSIEWVYIDTDTYEKAQVQRILERFPIPPTIVIESKRSYHVYWKVHCNSKEQFIDIFRRVNHAFCGDNAVGDISRVLRFPGFLHTKDIGDKFRVGIERINDNEYSVSDFKQIELPEEHFSKKHGTDDIRLIKDIPIKLVLDKLGIQYNRKNFILEGSEITSASINPSGNYINRFSGKEGSGSTIDATMHYGGRTLPEAIKWLKLTFGISTESAPFKNYRPTIDEMLDSKPNPFTWGTEELDKKITPIEKHHYIVFLGETGSGKTTFCMDMAVKNAMKGNRVMFLSLEMNRDDIILRTGRSYAGITKEQWARKSMTDTQRVAMRRKVAEMNGMTNLSLEHCETSYEMVADKILKAKPDIVFVDNFDLITANTNNDFQRQEDVARFFMDFTNNYHIPCIVLHHFNKPKTNVKTDRRDVASARGSSKIVHNADSVIVGIRNYKPENNEMENAEYIVCQIKDRDFGLLTTSVTYFNSGTFDDTFKGKTPVMRVAESFEMPLIDF